MTTLLAMLNVDRLVFLDESGCHQGMRREYGWGIEGQRVFAKRPAHRGKNLTMLGAIQRGRKPVVMTNVGATNEKVFLKFLRTRLIPWMRRGDALVMDNLQVHKTPAVLAALQQARIPPIFLPPYSPDMNPIELMWSDVKRQLRKLGADTIAALRAGVRRIRAAVPLRKVDNWIGHVFAQLK